MDKGLPIIQLIHYKLQIYHPFRFRSKWEVSVEAVTKYPFQKETAAIL